MISFAEALRILTEIQVNPKKEWVPLASALNRVLAQDMNSLSHMPPFHKSAMDGFACDSADDSERFEIIEVIAAGQIPRKRIRKGTCAKIMTGAMLPKGADRVVIKENTRTESGYMFITSDDPADHVRYPGEDVKIGDKVLSARMIINPAVCGVIASLGIGRVQVFKRPIIGLLVTGGEIIEPGKKTKMGQIFNSNAYSLSSQMMNLGIPVEYGGIVRDEKKAIQKKISDLLVRTDMILVSGGVSMGDYDYVPEILETLGFRLYFKKIAIKPGKPTVFGQKGKKFVFGMPGNPVSTFVVFEVLAKPFLYRLMGHGFEPLYLKGIMGQDFKKKMDSRTVFLPVRYRDGVVEIIEYHGSAHIQALPQGNGILEIPGGVEAIGKGTEVHVRSI